jgi:hypothetical protein
MDMFREHIHDHSLPHKILGSTMSRTNETYPWSFITTLNDHGYVSLVVVIVEPSILCGNEWSWICFVCRSHAWTKHSVWSLRHIILGSNMTTINAAYPWSFHYHTEYLVQLWVRQTEHIHDHSLPHKILGSTMSRTNETYPWSFITTKNTWFNYG